MEHILIWNRTDGENVKTWTETKKDNIKIREIKTATVRKNYCDKNECFAKNDVFGFR